jgi:putative membrane protein
MRWLMFLPLVLLLSLFALSNTEEVQLTLWPFDLAWAAPLGMAVLLLCAVSFLVGALLAWGASFSARRRAREVEAAARLLEAELATLKAREAEAQRAANLGRLPAPVA